MTTPTPRPSTRERIKAAYREVCGIPQWEPNYDSVSIAFSAAVKIVESQDAENDALRGENARMTRQIYEREQDLLSLRAQLAAANKENEALLAKLSDSLEISDARHDNLCSERRQVDILRSELAAANEERDEAMKAANRRGCKGDTMTADIERVTQGERLDAHLKLAAEKMGCLEEELLWSSWLNTFGSTAGPRKGGLSGQAFTTFRVYGFGNPYTGKLLKYCAGVWKDWGGHEEEW